MSDEIKKYETLKTHFREDYKWEFDKKMYIDNKTSYMLVLVSFLLSLLLNFFSNNNVVSYLKDIPTVILVFRCIIIFLYVGATTLCVISIFMYVIVLISRKYHILSNEKIFTKLDNDEESYENTVKLLATDYQRVAKHNNEINRKVIGKYKVATVLALIAMIITVIIFVLRFLMG